MKNKKIKKNTRETNINNTIKSILLSNREVNHTNLKFSILKEILLSNLSNEIFEKKTFDFRNLIIYYKNEINNDDNLESTQYYFNQIEQIRIKRINKIVESGKTKELTINKIKELNKDKDIEENWIERGYTTIKITNGLIEVKIEELKQLEYQIKMLKLETINNILTSSFSMDKNDFEKWIISIKDYSLKTYGNNPIVKKNCILLGENNMQLEKLFLYLCLSDGKIHIIKRIKYKN